MLHFCKIFYFISFAFKMHTIIIINSLKIKLNKNKLLMFKKLKLINQGKN